MSSEAKRRLAVLVLALLALWPAVHFGLYQRYGIESWKLCGWAMYARPRGTQQVALMELAEGGVRPIHEISDVARDELTRLSARRGVLGELQPMDSLAKMLLAERPTAEGIRIVVRQIRFDCDSARIDDVDDDSVDYMR